jgi:hypothetical protein
MSFSKWARLRRNYMSIQDEERRIDLEDKKKAVYISFEGIGKIALELAKFGERIGNRLEELWREKMAPLAEINWDEVEKNWKDSGESLARKGWTLPMNMTPAETFELSKIESLEELDNAFEEFYSIDKEYKR